MQRSLLFIAALLSLGAAAAPAQQLDMQMGRSMQGPLGVPMDRLASGTTWLADNASLPSLYFAAGDWDLMLHGFAFAQFDKQGGPRGGSQFGSLNWAMLMADRAVGGGRLELRFMPSLEAVTVGKCGYPLLLQSGETCNGSPLANRQHPHDAITELSVAYDREVSRSTALLLYIAPVGEPALGPVAFMHRPSAMDNPVAPLGHHWQDATHVAFGVATAGVYTKSVRLEGSAFNGIEPDDNRWDVDPIKFNSWSGRLTVNPSRSWSFTAGFGSIAEPKAGDPSHRLERLVGSAMYAKPMSGDRQWATTFVAGANREYGAWASSALVESEAVLGRLSVFGRAEVVDKSAEDLAVTAVAGADQFVVGAVTAGLTREIAVGKVLSLGLGATGTVNVVPSDLQSVYGSRTPMGALVFLRLRPVRSMDMDMPGM